MDNVRAMLKGDKSWSATKVIFSNIIPNVNLLGKGLSLQNLSTKQPILNPLCRVLLSEAIVRGNGKFVLKEGVNFSTFAIILLIHYPSLQVRIASLPFVHLMLAAISRNFTRHVKMNETCKSSFR